MRYLLIAVLVAGCSSSTAPIEDPIPGPQGPKGEVGPQGPAGPAGPAGAPGTSAIGVSPLSAGQLCPQGGALLKDSDGGSAVVCNGSQGAQGVAGTQGPAGPRGIPAQSLTLWDSDGGVVGPIISNGASDLVAVYVESSGCIAQIDYNLQAIKPSVSTIYYTQQNCSGIAFLATSGSSTYFPLGCLEMNGNTYRVQQPVLRQMINAASKMTPFFQADGGYSALCQNENSNRQGAALEAVNFTNQNGPFTFGIR